MVLFQRKNSVFGKNCLSMLEPILTPSWGPTWLPFGPQDAAKTAMADGALLNDVVNVPARSNLMRGRFEDGYLERIEAMVKEMNEQIASAVEAN